MNPYPKRSFSIRSESRLITIGSGNPVFIIAEMSGNHNASFETAVKIIDAAKKAGADAIKIQTYTPDTLTIDCDNDYFTVKTNPAWKGKSLYQLYSEAYTPWEWQPKLFEYAKEKNILIFSTPFDPTSVDFLEKLDPPLYKIASFEVGDIPLLERIGQTKKPVILSRGMSSVADIDFAIQTLKKTGCPEVAVLHCISAYPADASHMNLLTITDIHQRFNVVSGISDHTLGITVPVVSVGLGAQIIEKHFTLSRSMGGPDAAFSLEPDEFRQMVAAVREATAALGKINYDVGKSESDNIIFKKSIFVTSDIKKGDRFTLENIRVIRPGFGLHSRYYHETIGKKARMDLFRGTPLKPEHIDT